MAEAMGFELMDLLQSTVFKSEEYSLYINILATTNFRKGVFVCPLEPPEIKG